MNNIISQLLNVKRWNDLETLKQLLKVTQGHDHPH